MDILLINPYPEQARGINEATIYPPLGLVYIASELQKIGVNAGVLDANILKLNNQKILDLVNSKNPNIIGISSNIITKKATIKLLKDLKSYSEERRIIVGGPLPSIQPEEFLEFCDAVIVSEGEETCKELVKNKENRVKGLFVKRNKKVFFTGKRELISNIDKISFPDWSLLTPSLKRYKGRSRKTPVAPFLSSRGCPFQCVYCNKSVFGSRFRKRSTKNVLAEIDWLIEKFGVKQIDTLDDNFNLDIKRAKEICDGLIQKKYDLVINCQNGLRADMLDEELVHKMKKAGVFKVSLGIESGDQEVVNKIKKNLNLEKVKKAIKLFKKQGIIVYGNFMLGLPFDSIESMEKTINFAIKSNPDIANFMITIPLPGTELFNFLKKENKLIKDTSAGVLSGFYAGEVFYETERFKKEDVKRLHNEAYKRFFIRPKKIFELLSNIHSTKELKWTIDAAKPLAKKCFIKKKFLSNLGLR